MSPTVWPLFAILAIVTFAASLAPCPAGALQTTAGDSLRLGELHADAVRRDPRARQLELLGSQSSLRRASLDAERLPSLNAVGVAQYLSDVPTVPFAVPGGGAPVLPPNDSYDLSLAARQRLYDPGLRPRRALEDAQLAESRSRVRTTLYGLRQAVNEAYFSALLLQAHQSELANGVTDLEAQLQVTRDRVRLGTALPSEGAALEAELLRRRQSIDEVTASREAALVVLRDLTGRALTTNDVLLLPDLAVMVTETRAATGEERGRPEYEQFTSTREVISRRQDALAAQDRPRLSAFGRAGYGRPGLNPLAREFDEYWVAGLQVEWAPWRWGAAKREREELDLQQQIVATEEGAFAATIRRSAARDLADIDRLARALGSDAEIIALRERILVEVRHRFGESAIGSAELIDRETDVLAARLTRATHQVELSRARAHFLTLVGREVR